MTTPPPSDIEQRLIGIVLNDLDVTVAEAQVTPTAPLFEDGLGLDSIALVELIALVEERFEVFFEDSELTMDTFRDLRTLAGLIHGRLAEQSAGATSPA